MSGSASGRSGTRGAEASARLARALRANAPDVLTYLERRIEPASDAADVLSEVMTVAWRRVDRLPVDGTEARMWLFGIASRTLLAARRGARRRSVATERLRGELERVAATQPSEVEVTDVTVDVHAAIAALPAPLAELVRLLHWEGFTLVEIAVITGTTASTTRSRYARARQLLRTTLGDAPTIGLRAASLMPSTNPKGPPLGRNQTRKARTCRPNATTAD